MTEFHAQLMARAQEAAQLLSAARSSGDDYSVDVHQADLDNIARIAHDHGVALTALGLDEIGDISDNGDSEQQDATAA